MNSITEETIEPLDSKSYNLSLQNEEYELTMSLTESFIQFKLVPKIFSGFYNESSKITLSIIKENKYLINDFTELKNAYLYFDERKFKKNKIKLIKQKEDSIYLNYTNNVDDEEKEVNIELKQFKIEKGDINPMILDQIKELRSKISEVEKHLGEMKKEMLSIQEKQEKELNQKIELAIEAYLKKKKEEEEIKKQKEEEIKKQKDEEIKKEIEKTLVLNDNVNYSNDFQCDNFDNATDVNYINGNFNLDKKRVAIYPIIRNNEIIYELACAELENKGSYNYNYNIVIYNILTNKKTNNIYDAHSGSINNIKHYYSSSLKKHFLLSSNQQEVKLWNITSSKTFTKELHINNVNNNDGYSCYCSCLLFKNDDYFILTGGNKTKNGYGIKIFNKGENIKSINGSGLEYIYYIEATYINNKPYVLLSGNYHAESYNYDNEKIIKYISNENEKEKEKQYCNIINLFNKNNKLYLIVGYSKGLISIFDFKSAVEIDAIKIGNTCIYGLCSFNEKYFLFGDNKEITVINFDDRNKITSFKGLNDDCIKGIEKIKIYDKGEYIISYSNSLIIFWKLSK